MKVARMILSVLLIIPFNTNGQIINSITDAIYHPVEMLFDKNGNLYVCSNLGNVIKKIDVNGVITTVAGTGQGGYNGDGGLADTSMLWQPYGIALDTANNLYIGDKRNNRIRRVNLLTGIITTFAGTGVNGFSGDGGPAILANFYQPASLHIDKFGNMYVGENQFGRIRKIDATGIVTTVAGIGSQGYSGDGAAATSAQISAASHIITDIEGNFYFSDFGQLSGNCIRKVDIVTGIITTIAGTGVSTMVNYNGDNIPAISADMNPTGIAFDSLGNLYLADVYNCRIRKIDVNGIIHTVAGDGTFAFGGDGGAATFAQLNRPSGIAFDTCGNLYFTEIQQGRIRKVDFNPNCWPVNVNEHKQLSFNLYPNPANENITITGNNLQGIIIANTLGQIVHTKKATQEKTVVDISALNAGIYFVTVTDKQGVKVTKKVVKE